MRGVVAGIAALVVAAGCSAANEPDPGASSPTPSASGTASPSPTAASLSPAEQDKAAAGEAVLRYMRVYEDLSVNTTKPFDVIDTVAQGQAAEQMRVDLTDSRGKKLRQTGEQQLGAPVVSTTDGKTFTVDACLDVTGVDVVDESGVSVVTSLRRDRQVFRYEVTKTDKGFFVTLNEYEAVGPC